MINVGAPGGRFDGRVAVITGAAHGIGRAVAERLVAEGAQVVLADLDLDALSEVAAELAPAAVITAECDVRSSPSVDAAIAAAVDHFGGLDLLVTVAGGSIATSVFEELPDETWDAMLDLNLTGVMRCIRAAVPQLRRRGGGAIVAISSVNGLAAFGEEPYSAAKAGLSNLARNLAVRFGPDGIRVNVVAPGTVRTRVWDGQEGGADRLRPLYPLGRVGEPSDIAAAVAFLASDEASWITGVTLPVDGGALAGPAQLMPLL